MFFLRIFWKSKNKCYIRELHLWLYFMVYLFFLYTHKKHVYITCPCFCLWHMDHLFSRIFIDLTYSRNQINMTMFYHLQWCYLSCYMGARYSCFLVFFDSFFMFQAHTTCFCFSLHRNAIAFKHENYKEKLEFNFFNLDGVHNMVFTINATCAC